MSTSQQLLGADPDDLERCATHMLGVADQFDCIPRVLGAQIRTTAWTGAAAKRFGSEWKGSHEPSLRKAAAHLRLSAERLLAQAKQQRLASSSELLLLAGQRPPHNLAQDPLQNLYQSNRASIATELQVLRAQRDDWLQMPVVGGLLSGIRYLPFDPLESIDKKIAWLRSLQAKPRNFLFVDTRQTGHAAEVFGRLDLARHVAVVVPGVGSDLGDFAQRSTLPAAVLQGAASDTASDTAVVQWLGYNPPPNLVQAALNGGESAQIAAVDGAKQLRGFVDYLRQMGVADVTVIGHSLGAYLASVAAGTGPGLNADRLVFAGSPGSLLPNVEELHLYGGPGSGSTVFFVEQGRDPISAAVFGRSLLGTNVADPDFGATQLLDGQAGFGNLLRNHSNYFRDPVTVQSVRAVIRGGP